jgi:hypothetical protein
VLGFFAVRCSHTLPCILALPCGLLAAHGKEIFAVQHLTAKIGCTAAPDFPVVSGRFQMFHKYLVYSSKANEIASEIMTHMSGFSFLLLPFSVILMLI